MNHRRIPEPERLSEVDVSTRTHEKTLFLRVRGRFTFTDDEDWLRVVAESLPDGTDVEIDLSEVTFVDIAAVGMLLTLREFCIHANGTFAIVGSSAYTLSMFEKWKVADVLIDSRRDATPLEDRARSAVERKALAGYRVLLAEDRPDIQHLIGRILRRSGAQLTIVGDGRTAVNVAHHARIDGEPFDVIAMDMLMPVMDGFEACRQLRIRAYEHPIVAVTALAMAQDRERCFDVGCDDYVAKPLDAAHLVSTLEDCCQAGRRRRAAVRSADGE